MTDSFMLRAWITKKGYKLKAVAAKLGITPYALQKKIENKSEFKASEIAAFVNDLGMTPKDRDLIFFTRNVEL
jgi:transcriptional regulator with XRE-family HTH domain